MLVLASGSPRRRALLAQVGYRFRVVPPREEPEPPDLPPEEAAQEIARFKAQEVLRRIDAGVVLAADTLVVLGDRVLGKPQDLVEARAFLQVLQGKAHRVVTGVAVTDGRQTLSAAEVTWVHVAPMTGREISWVLERDAPLDKAGAYAIQGAMALFIPRIEGDYTNVVGLPLPLTYRLLARFGVYPFE